VPLQDPTSTTDFVQQTLIPSPPPLPTLPTPAAASDPPIAIHPLHPTNSTTHPVPPEELTHIPTQIPSTVETSTRRSARGASKPNGFWAGSSFSSTLNEPIQANIDTIHASYVSNLRLISGHHFRKRINLKAASICDREHLLAYPIPEGLNNRATDIRPSPPPRQQNEFTIRKALNIFPADCIAAALDKEITKCFTTYQSLRLIDANELEEGAVFIRSQCIIREKLDGSVTARIPVDGGSQPTHTFDETFAGTTDANHRQFALAAAQADAAHRLKTLYTGSCDIPAAFINGNKLPRSATGGVQLYIRLSKELPGPYGGALAAIDGSPGHYGLRKANNIYD
jgi:hypothetical protein